MDQRTKWITEGEFACEVLFIYFYDMVLFCFFLLVMSKILLGHISSKNSWTYVKIIISHILFHQLILLFFICIYVSKYMLFMFGIIMRQRVPVSLAQLVGTLHNLCRGRGSNSGHPISLCLIVWALAIRLLNKKIIMRQKLFKASWM